MIDLFKFHAIRTRYGSDALGMGFEMRHGLVLIIALMAGGCTSTVYTMTGVAIGKQVVTMDRGTAIVQSAWQGSTVAVQPASADLNGEIGLFVTLENTSAVAGNFGTENIATSNDGLTWTPVKSYEQLKQKLASHTAWQKFGAALIGSLDMAAASQAGNYNEHGYVSGPYGGATFDVSGVDRGEQMSAMNAAAGRSSETMQSIDKQYAMNAAQLDALALRTTTVEPGMHFEGLVVADAPKLGNNSAVPIFVRINFLNDTHIVEFQAHVPGNFVAVPISSTVLATETDHDIVPGVPHSVAKTAQGTQTQVVADRATPAASLPTFQRYDVWLKQHAQNSKPNSNSENSGNIILN